METLRLWTRPHAQNLALIREQHGVELFDAAIAAGRGVIVAAPHYGNWELLNQWLASRTPLAILYRAAGVGRSARPSCNLRARRRTADADRVTQVRAEGPAMRQLFKLLKERRRGRASCPTSSPRPAMASSRRSSACRR